MRIVTAYVDESGDLGFGPLSSFFFSVVALSSDDPRSIERIPQRIRKRRLKKSLLVKPELKFNNSDAIVRKAVLEEVAALGGIAILGLTIDKRSAGQHWTAHREDIYDDISEELIWRIVQHWGRSNDFRIIFDARPRGRRERPALADRLCSGIDRRCWDLGIRTPRLKVSRLDSGGSRGLQVADFVAAAIRRSYELDDRTYRELIASGIVSDECSSIDRKLKCSPWPDY